MRVTWIGHSTVLLELDGVRVLTDPLLRRLIAHVRRVGRSPDLDLLSELDAVVVSHAHYDHLDMGSLKRVSRSVPFLVPRGVGRLLTKKGFADVTELRPDDESRVGEITIRATHAEHDGRRPFLDDPASLGFVFTGSASVYFAGDTDLFDDMSEIAADLDVALLPVAGWGPRLPPGHLDPLRAAQALRLLRPRIAIPIHWGTYRRIGMTRDPAVLHEPPDAFARFAAELAPDVDVRVLEVGAATDVAGRVASPAPD